MKRIRFIYNPVAGDAKFKNRLDTVIKNFQKSGYMVSPYRLMGPDDMDNALCDIDEKYSAVAISGGDGSINNLINAMKRNDIDLPIGIFPFGTSNDFAAHMRIPRNVNKCCEIITDGELLEVDTGVVNGYHFVNVCSAGLLADVAYKTDIGMKNSLGKIAYYLRGFEEIPKLRPISMKLEYDDKAIEDELYLFLVLNGSSAGGFPKLAPYASVYDGLLDVIAIRAANIPNIINLVVKVLRGEHVGDPNIYHFQTDNLKISSDETVESDIDGERGPFLPLDVKVDKKSVKVFIPR
ncbi:YegS/Rv2252/BmrU family lipid kinase [Lutispora thermophila]|uniref:Lipid kinase, YegS/Rv2252/BmrU family n=1 Tax=Lutispora thermophila DSM 19022 TaxID=1122184 RepID=A0A1M6EIM6_9FIRM|nr:YegS/Rv2252/BmrU family lipid kinase [Lutispora thermophila]SHI85335.1 lipid kinase, YegS/Rv2252/BmrU family [Lutispora thermophila DSM 19022]